MTGLVNTPDIAESDIAIVGMAARLPGAARSTRTGPTCATASSRSADSTDEELLAAGESPDRLRHQNYVPRGGAARRLEMFDADFFGFSPKEAAIMDPQHRHFLEVAWEALEDAGHVPERFDGPIGVFAGCGMGSYFYFNSARNPELVDQVGLFLLRHTGNDKDFLATRVSYLFDLQGSERQRADRVLDVARRDPLRLPEPAHRRVRHGARRRRDDRAAAPARLPLPGGRDPLAGRPLPRLRPPRAGHRLRQRRRRRRAAAARGRARRRRPRSTR